MKKKDNGKGWKYWKISDIELFGGGVNGVLKIIGGWLGEKKKGVVRVVATVNPEFVMRAGEDREFALILREKIDLNVMDGIGLVWAKQVQISKIKYQNLSKNLKILGNLWAGLKVGVEILQGKHGENLVPGVELVDRLCGLGYRVGFLGGWDDRARRTEEHFKRKYKNLKSVAIGSEYDGKTGEVVDIIREKRVEILFVAYAMVKQEKWIVANRKDLGEAGVKVAMGVGRSFDYYSGSLPRAPEWVRRGGLEWLYSWLTDPERRGRKQVLLKFIWRVLFRYGDVNF